MNRTVLVPVLALAAFAASCVQSADGTYLFQTHSTRQSVSAGAPLVVRERWLAYLASELTTGGGGTDFNGDGDTIDQVAVLVNMVGVKETRLDTAARELAIIGSQLYLVTEESEDGVDWDTDGTPDELVLLHSPCDNISPPAGASHGSFEFVAKLDRSGSGPRMLATAGDRLFYMGPAPTVGAETSLWMIKLVSGAPQAPARLLNEDNASTLRPELVGQDSGIVFATLNETLEGRDLNGDTDTTDDFVLALVDSTSATPKVKSVGLPMAGATAPLRALDVGGGDWVVAFLVDEAAQGAGSLNNFADLQFLDWRPTYCVGDGNDTDTTDEVLHFLRFQSWLAGTSDPVDTAFAGDTRVLAMLHGTDAYVATLVPEDHDGNCPVDGLNNDGDTADHVLRWIKVEAALGSSGVFIDEAGLVAVADVPGGTHGVTDLAGRWIAVIDEAADGRSWDGLVLDHDVVAWLDPDPPVGGSIQWTSDHSICASGCAGVQAAGASWMGEEASRRRTFVSFQESVLGASINGRDTDLNDSVPTFARFDPQDAADFDFPGPAIAADAGSTGVVYAGLYGFFRVDESADNFDWNGDGDKLDRVLFRTTVSSMQDTLFVSTLSVLDRPALETDTRALGAGFIVSESQARQDINSDGDQNDLVVRWMRIGE